jgi:lipopolysaccharide biosynthesis regulator YciM
VRWLSRAFGGDARVPRSADAALREALLAVLDGDLDRAEELLTAIVRRDSAATDAYLALARLWRRRGEVGRAIRIHQNLLLRVDAGSAEGRRVLLDLAGDFRQGGFHRRAIAAYEEVLGHEPRNPFALRALVGLLAEARDHPRAIEMARRLARVEGRDASGEEARLRVEMAEAAAAEGRSHDARRAVKQALRKDRACVRAWGLLGDLEAERGRSRAALAAWSRVPRLDRAGARRVYPRLEATYAALGRTREYETFLRELLTEAPEDAVARMALARTLAERGDADDAISELRQALARDADDLEARGALGRLLLSESRDEEATKEYAELLDVLERRGLLGSREGVA